MKTNECEAPVWVDIVSDFTKVDDCLNSVANIADVHTDQLEQLENKILFLNKKIFWLEVGVVISLLVAIIGCII